MVTICSASRKSYYSAVQKMSNNVNCHLIDVLAKLCFLMNGITLWAYYVREKVRIDVASICTIKKINLKKIDITVEPRFTVTLPYGKLANFWKSQTGRLVRATKIAISVLRQNARRATTKSPGSTMVKNNSFITGMMNSNHIQIK